MTGKPLLVAIIGAAMVCLSCKREHDAVATPKSENVARPETQNKGPFSAQDAQIAETLRERHSVLNYLTAEEYRQLAIKARDGDADSAFRLYTAFTYGANRDYGLAYYWGLKAHALGSTKISEKDIHLAEETVLNLACSPPEAPVAPGDEGVLPGQ